MNNEILRHERIYRGPETMQRLQRARVTLCGAGAVGSHLAVNLARQGVGSLVVIDRDRVEQHNPGTQIFAEAEIGLRKADCLRNRIFDEVGLEVDAIAREITTKNIDKHLRGARLVVDSFDNHPARAAVTAYCRRTAVPCLHVGLAADYAEVIWNEGYRVPGDQGIDVCNYAMARNVILLAVAVASECVIRFLTSGERASYTITLEDFAVRRHVVV